MFSRPSRNSPLPNMLILGSSSSAANKDMRAKIWTNGDTDIYLNKKHCGKWRNCLLRAVSPFSTMFLKTVCCSCVKMSIYGVKGLTFVFVEPTWSQWQFFVRVQPSVWICRDYNNFGTVVLLNE